MRVGQGALLGSTAMIVLDDKGEPMGDFREVRYDLSGCDENPEGTPNYTHAFVTCLVVLAIICVTLWVLRVADPLLDKMDEQGRAQAVRWGHQK